MFIKNLRRRKSDEARLTCHFDLNESITAVSDSFAAFYQCEAKDLVGLALDEIGPGRLGRELSSFVARATKFSPGAATRERTVEGLDHMGRRHWIHWTERAVFDNNRRFRGLELSGVDVTKEQMRLEDEAYQNSCDPLTGLMNRECFLLDLDQHVQAAEHGEALFGLLLIDVNVTQMVDLGRHSTDRIVEEAAERVAATFRASDTVGRMGPTTFGVICEQLPALSVLNALRSRLEFAVGEPMIGIPGPGLSARCGTVLGTEGQSGEALLAEAESQLNCADDMAESQATSTSQLSKVSA